jgi:hypothetical protein
MLLECLQHRADRQAPETSPRLTATAPAVPAPADAELVVPAAHVARALRVLIRCAVERPGQMSRVGRHLAEAAAQLHRRATTRTGYETAAEPAVLAAMGVATVALQRVIEHGPAAMPPPLVRDLVFGLLRALGLSDATADLVADEAAADLLMQAA